MKFAAAFLLASSLFAADDVPAWMRTAAAAKLPTYDAKTPAVVLLNESNVTVQDSGRVVTTDRFAIKILNREGVKLARAAKFYLRDTGKVRDIKGWVITASGETKKLAKERYADAGVGADSLYEDIRARIVDATRDCDPGAVFGYESTIEEKSIFTQEDFDFSDGLPVHVSRFSLSLPIGWSAKALTFNHAPVQATESGTTQTWELQDLPMFEPEPLSPAFRSLEPRLAISFYPTGAGGTILGPSFRTWSDVSSWLSDLHEPQSVPDAAIVEKVRVLTASATTPEEKLRAIAEYVQGIRYVSIQTGLGRGGGYTPHAASLVFRNSYGDCKDKANLLRAMLKAVGIESYPVSIYSGDALYVRDEWPTPHQFNHCILAIRVAAGYQAPAVVEDAQLGRLLIFDPTDAYTPVGELPLHEQNSFALVMAGARGALLRMPPATADANITTRRVQASVDPAGAVKGELHEEMKGWTAVVQRAYLREGGEKEYRRRVDSRLGNTLRNANIENVKTSDAPREDRFGLDLDFSAASYAQMMQGKMMVFRPSLIDMPDSLPLVAKNRKYPAVVAARSWHDTVTTKLPAGFEVDELPAAVKLETVYGTYESRSSVKAGVLTFTRVLVLRPSVVPPDQYPALKAFADGIGGADQAPIVLIRK